MQYDISHIVSVYNKATHVPYAAASLLNQRSPLSREFIFMDDNSSDNSVQLLREAAQGNPHVRIITHTDNKGPSIRLNEGAALARGKYLHFLDHDDAVPVNAIQVMYDTLEKTGGDFLYGTWRKTGKDIEELLNESIEASPAYSVSDTPLTTLLRGRFKRMCVLTSKALFDKAGGFDGRIFIQDESLPLRLALHAKRFVSLNAVVNLVPKEDSNLSLNKHQLNHDRFLAYYYAIMEHADIPRADRKWMFYQAISCMWKEVRATRPLPWISGYFVEYVLAKHILPSVSIPMLEKYKGYFDHIPHVRRVF